MAGMGIGALTLSPFMSAVHASIRRQVVGGKQPMRFVFCMKGNGLWAELIQPQQMKERLPFSYQAQVNEKGGQDIIKESWQNNRRTVYEAADLALGDSALSETMSPLEPFRDRVSVLQGLSGGFEVYHAGHYQALAATAARKRDTPEVVGPTIDALLAKAFAAPVPHVCLGHDSTAPAGLSYISISAADRNKPNAFYTKPVRAYADLFGVVDRGAARDRYDVQTTILDFHAQDAKRLRNEIAGPEREQLDRYLDAFDTVREKRANIEAMADRLRAHAPDEPDDIQVSQPVEIASGHAEIASAALVSGLTNVVTICFDQLGTSTYPGAGGLHRNVGHGQGGDVLGKRERITGSHFEQIAKIAHKLHSVPEGDGTMLDNTLFVYLPDNGGAHHSSQYNWPVVMLGDLGGRIKSGHYHAFANEPTNDKTAPSARLGDLWATLLNAAGLEDQPFGVPRNGIAHQPLGQVLA